MSSMILRYPSLRRLKTFHRVLAACQCRILSNSDSRFPFCTSVCMPSRVYQVYGDKNERKRKGRIILQNGNTDLY